MLTPLLLAKGEMRMDHLPEVTLVPSFSLVFGSGHSVQPSVNLAPTTHFLYHRTDVEGEKT